MNKKLFIISTLFAFIGLLTVFLSNSSSVRNVKADSDNPQVTICHRNDDVNNPYTTQTPNVHNNGSLDGGHQDHTGPLATSVTVAQALKDANTKWGDIIPQYNFLTCPDKYHLDSGKCERGGYPDVSPTPGSYPGLNWTTDGQAIWNNKCNIPTDVCSNIDGIQTTVPDGDYQSNGACYPKTHVCTAPTATNYDDNVDSTEVADNSVCTYPEDPCETNPDSCVTPIVTITTTPTATPTATPTTTSNGGGGGDGLGCATHDCSGNQVGGGSSQAVLGASTSVLGASTMASTGTFEENTMNLLAAAGIILMGLSTVYAKAQKALNR